MTETDNELLSYLCSSTGEAPDGLRAIAMRDVPDFEDNDCLDMELKALWPQLPPPARMLAWLIARNRSSQDNSLWDRHG